MKNVYARELLTGELDCCARCGAPAEVSYPDGEGDQIGFCAVHEPVGVETGETYE